MSGFLNQWNMYTGNATEVPKYNPYKSKRSQHYAGPFEEWPILWAEIPEYQELAIECPSCCGDLHYSHGWGRRTCMLCGYIEGVGGHHVYPRAVSVSEWLFTIGQLFQQVLDGHLTRHEFRDEMRQLTFVGSVHRPYGEEP